MSGKNQEPDSAEATPETPGEPAADIALVRDGAAAEQSTVEAATELVAFSEAVFGLDPDEIARTREALEAAVGAEGVVDSAAVAANFQRMVRIADGCGIPLDAPMLAMSEDTRDELSLGEFAASANTPEPGLGMKLAAPLLRRMHPLIVRMARRKPKNG